MADRSYWPGHASNRSTQNVWVTWDEGEDDNRKILAKILTPGRRSPHHIDIDGVQPYGSGVQISGYGGWWKLGGGAEVDITDGNAGDLVIEQTSLIGALSQEADDFMGPGTNWDSQADATWGDKCVELPPGGAPAAADAGSGSDAGSG